jgi:hypothetical protein
MRRDDVFAAKRSGQFEHLLAALGTEDDLRDAVPIAKIDERAAAVVSVAVHPAAESNFGINVIGAEFAASVSA